MADVSPRYRIVRRLGQGGMAEVFEAELHGELGFVRRVAIKQLSQEALRDPNAAQRFVDESRIASRLHHAHIVAVLDVGLLDDRPFQALELVDGLDAYVLLGRSGGAVPIEVALILVHAVAHALDHAHNAADADGQPLGIVHRDVKPSNILIAWSGDVKLADFGIAVAHDRVAKTETGAVAGTRGFIPPEQRTRSQLDGRSDVFALGLTLHALCTGATPLSDVIAEARLLLGEPLALDPALPADVHALIERAVRPDRRDRPTAAELAASIGEALAARGIRDVRSVIRDFVAPFRGLPRSKGALDALLGVEIVMVGTTGGTVQRYATEAPRPEPEATPPRADEPRAPAPSRSRRGVALAGAGAVLALGGAASLRWLAASDPTVRVPATVDAAVAMVPPDAPPPDAPSDGPLEAAVARVPADAAGPTIAQHVPPPPRRRSSPRPSAAPAGPASSVGNGYVQVVGEELLRARVLIDGTFVGYVPNRFTVPLGHHRVEVERPDGVRLPARELDVTSFHTAKNPARPAW